MVIKEQGNLAKDERVGEGKRVLFMPLQTPKTLLLICCISKLKDWF